MAARAKAFTVFQIISGFETAVSVGLRRYTACTDIELYVDPYALHISPVDWLRVCGDLVVNYFQLLLRALKEQDGEKAMMLLSNLREPNETRFGQSKKTRTWPGTQASHAALPKAQQE